jgi:uncharacterized protein YbjT (DUF2867 family)
MDKNKILVTGATGTIGTFVVEGLKELNVDFVALVRSEEKAAKLEQQGINTVIGDLSDNSSLESALEGIDKVFLLSVTSPDSPEHQGNLVKVAKQKGVKHIVKVSARGTATDANFNIGRWHAVTENQIKESGISYTFLHCHSFLQNLFFDAGTIKEQNAIYSSMGDGKIGMVDARDIAAVAVKTLTESGHENKTYVLTGPEAVSYYDVAEVLTKNLGKKISYVPLSLEAGRKGMLDSGMPEWLVNDMTSINKIYAENKGSEISPDIETVTGNPPVGLEKFVQDFIDVFK